MSERIDTHKDPTLCMVVDCEKRAIYRNARASKRGYCSEHRALAFGATDYLSEQYDSFANWLDRSAS